MKTITALAAALALAACTPPPSGADMLDTIKANCAKVYGAGSSGEKRCVTRKTLAALDKLQAEDDRRAGEGLP